MTHGANMKITVYLVLHAITRKLLVIRQGLAFQAEADRLYNCDFFPNNWMRGRFLQTFCRDGAPTQIFCSSILYLIGGLNSTQLNTASIVTCTVINI